jgi:hypothetical protein
MNAIQTSIYDPFKPRRRVPRGPELRYLRSSHEETVVVEHLVRGWVRHVEPVIRAVEEAADVALA